MSLPSLFPVLYGGGGAVGLGAGTHSGGLSHWGSPAAPWGLAQVPPGWVHLPICLAPVWVTLGVFPPFKHLFYLNEKPRCRSDLAYTVVQGVEPGTLKPQA